MKSFISPPLPLTGEERGCTDEIKIAPVGISNIALTKTMTKAFMRPSDLRFENEIINFTSSLRVSARVSVRFSVRVGVTWVRGRVRDRVKAETWKRNHE
jgi:hypothetical protein